MHDAGDIELLRDYAQQGSEDAFAELVRRHVNLVYSTACRQVTVAAHAEEITQAVFVVLARKAAGLRPDTILDAWLYETTRLTALSFLRGERRRQAREQEAYMQSTQPESGEVWNQLAPLLEEAMAGLSQRDREAVVLRFFKEKRLGEVAAIMQITETAAQSCIYRAVDKLRAYFAKRGVTLSAAGLTTAIAANSVQSAPVGLAAAVTTAALSGTALTPPALIAATKTIAMTTLQKIVVTVTLATLAGACIYQARQLAQLREQNQGLLKAQGQQVEQLQRDREDATNRVAATLANNDQNRLRKEHLELLSLRGRVTQLANALRESTTTKPLTTFSTNRQAEEKSEDSIFLTATAATNYVSSGNTLIVGGWALAGRRSYLLIKPEIVPGDPALGGKQIAIQGHIIQAPESFWDDIGWGSYTSGTHRSTVAGELTSNQADLLLQALEKTQGGEISTTVPTTVANGKRSGYGFSRQEDDGSGGVLMGVDFYPRISADGQTVSLEFISFPVPENIPIHPALKSH